MTTATTTTLDMLVHSSDEGRILRLHVPKSRRGRGGPAYPMDVLKAWGASREWQDHYPIDWVIFTSPSLDQLVCDANGGEAKWKSIEGIEVTMNLNFAGMVNDGGEYVLVMEVER
jgi:hypothetical protein